MINCNIFGNSAPGPNNIIGGVCNDEAKITADNATAIHDNTCDDGPCDCNGWSDPACGRYRPP